MPENNKPKHTKADDLAHFLAGKRPLRPGSFSMTDLTEALGKLLSNPDISESDIESGVRAILRSRSCYFDDVNIVKRALKVRNEGQPLFAALMGVRQARARRRVHRRR